MSWPEFLGVIAPGLAGLLVAGAAYLKAKAAHTRIDNQDGANSKKP